MIQKVKIKTNIDTLSAIVLILRHVNAVTVAKANYTTLVMQSECMMFAIKLLQNTQAKSIKLPSSVCIALYYFYETVMPLLGTYEQAIYRNIITDMDILYNHLSLQKRQLFLQ